MNASIMEQENKPQEQNENESKGKGLLILFIVLTVLFAGVSTFLFLQLNDLKQEMTSLISQRDESVKDVDVYRAQLQLLTAKYDSLIATHEGLRAELEEERGKVVQLMVDYDRLKKSGESSTPEGGSSLRQRLEQLQKSYDENVDIIAELRARNKELTDENFRNSKIVEETNLQNEKLTQENSKLVKTVEVAKRLKTYEMYADAVRVSGGGSKEKQTDKASKADRIRVCFTILDNQLADKQEKLLYAVVQGPDKRVLTDGDKSKLTLLNGEEIAYSVKKEVFYDNKVMQLCLNWEVKEKLTAGEYKVEVYSDGVQIGNSDFTLK